MTRKHLQALADTIKDVSKQADTAAERAIVVKTAKKLADTCARFNSGFKRARFLTACGM